MQEKKKQLWFLKPDIIFTLAVLVIMLFYFLDVNARAKGYEGVLISSVFFISAACFVWMLIANWRQSKREAARQESADGEPDAAQSMSVKDMYTHLMTKKQVVFSISIIAYVALINVLGFLIATVLFLVFVLRFMGERKWLKIVLIAACLAVALDALFTIAFDIPLPSGLIHFGMEVWF